MQPVTSMFLFSITNDKAVLEWDKLSPFYVLAYKQVFPVFTWIASAAFPILRVFIGS